MEAANDPARRQRVTNGWHHRAVALVGASPIVKIMKNVNSR
jgi:hypothetical protein